MLVFLFLMQLIHLADGGQDVGGEALPPALACACRLLVLHCRADEGGRQGGRLQQQLLGLSDAPGSAVADHLAPPSLHPPR